MIWKLIGSGGFNSNEDGSELITTFDTQDFGLSVGEVLFALEVLERGDAAAQVRVIESHGASLETANYVFGSDDVVSSTAVDEQVPTTLFASRTFSVPYFRVSVGVSSDVGQRGSVYLKLYAGGR